MLVMINDGELILKRMLQLVEIRSLINFVYSPQDPLSMHCPLYGVTMHNSCMRFLVEDIFNHFPLPHYVEFSCHMMQVLMNPPWNDLNTNVNRFLNCMRR